MLVVGRIIAHRSEYQIPLLPIKGNIRFLWLLLGVPDVIGTGDRYTGTLLVLALTLLVLALTLLVLSAMTLMALTLLVLALTL
ncbi:MAG: hypothetical protein CME25_22590, partial [Gemmatimonadetes bacterium]|nr:hypothetical protein [Gemmatimonadota bacterium]